MKRIVFKISYGEITFFTVSLVFFLCSAFAQVCLAQWQPDMRLTNSTGFSETSFSNARCISANGNYVHAVWFDNRDNNNTGKWEIYYKRSTDAGITWDADIRMTFDTNSWAPSIAVSGSYVHIVWWKMDNPGIYYMRSTNGGISWETAVRLNVNSCWSPSIAASGSYVHLVYENLSYPAGSEIEYRRSTDDGATWGAVVRLTNDTVHSSLPSIAVSGSQVHVVWDERDSRNHIYHRHSADGGLTWGAISQLSENNAFSISASIAVAGSLVHTVWEDRRNDNSEIYYKRSTDGGATWGVDTRLTNFAESSQLPSIAVSDNLVHVVWYDWRDANTEIYYKQSYNGGTNWAPDTRLTENADISLYPSVAVSGPLVHVIWRDVRDIDAEIYYKRNPTGNIGIQNISTEIPSSYSLSQNYPNPFNPLTSFEFRVAESGFVNLTIYDAIGRVVEILQNGELQPGIYKADWDASNYPSGVYFYKLSAGSFTETKKMILIK
ncbi:MAG TPA: exo-alpha-sialidase [Ignavibacteria bacterium]|nr:exo-alpha-sialidase [Ignavibacteria bacterium]HMQ99041.1 exo-alpha-sialidase [Ignavibacteria bacterium]